MRNPESHISLYRITAYAWWTRASLRAGYGPVLVCARPDRTTCRACSPGLQCWH